jgi:TolA-binding protein
MSTREQEQKPPITDRLSRFLQKSRIPLLITLIVLVVFQAETAQELYQQWQDEQDPDAKQSVEEELRLLVTDIRKSYPRQYAAQRAAFLEGALEYELERWEPAAKAFASLASRAPKSYLAPLALMNAGICYERLANPAEALSAYRRVADDYPDSFLVAEVLFAIGRVEEQEGNFQAAVQAYNRLEEEHPLSNWTKLGRNRIIALKIDGKTPGEGE